MALVNQNNQTVVTPTIKNTDTDLLEIPSAEEIAANTGLVSTTVPTVGKTGATGETGDTTVIGSSGSTSSSGASGTVYNVGSEYPNEWKQSWEKDAEEQAGLQLLQDVADVETSQLASRESIETNGNSGNTEYTMLTYQQNQNIDKMGWGGGSYLDAKTQEEYIKASIQADLYSQLDLQRYGYTTELAKARAAYDANQKQLALEYMNQAYTQAYNTASITGVWIDPTVSDRLSQWDVAGKMMEEANPDSEAYAKAKTIRESILASFNVSGTITEQGVDVLRELLQQQNLYSEDTYTAAQIASLNVETDNAEELANAELQKTKEADGIYTYTANGKQVEVNMFGNDWDSINAVLAEKPALKYQLVATFSDTLNAEFVQWQTANTNGSDVPTKDEFIKENPGAYDSLFNQALAWAQKAGMETFVFDGKSYPTKNDDGTNIIPEDTPTQTTTTQGLITNDDGTVSLSYGGETYDHNWYVVDRTNGGSPDTWTTLQKRIEQAGVTTSADNYPSMMPSVIDDAKDIDDYIEFASTVYKDLFDKIDINKFTNDAIIENRNQEVFKLLGVDTDGAVTLAELTDEQEAATVKALGGVDQINALIAYSTSTKLSTLTDPYARKVWWLGDWLNKQKGKFDL